MPYDNIQRLSAYLDGELDDTDVREVEQALSTSSELRKELQRLEALRGWASQFPGRQPHRDIWSDIESRIANNPGVIAPTETRSRDPHRAERFFSLLPFYSVESGWSKGARRTAIFGLAGIAMAGMGRSFYQEQRANLFEEETRVKDEQLVRATTDAAWSQTATEMRGQVGRRLALRCPRGGTASVVWGSGVYTDDSSICTAAVHAGLIEFATGGPVQIEVGPGLMSYRGESRNGVTSHAYGSYDGSFVFVPEGEKFRFNFEFLFDSSFSSGTSAETIGWNEDAEELRGLEGTHHTFRCVGGGQERVVWGSGPYTDDSSICTAAVHAGAITPEDGGLVTIFVEGKHPRFVGSERNGIETRGYGSWDGSFIVLTDELLAASEPPVEIANWRMTATQMRGWNGFETTMECPASGEASVVWGSDTYTDDSSICTAAVHAGIISFENGGLVTIAIGPGLEDYVGENRNGVQSRRFGSWAGSFRFVR